MLDGTKGHPDFDLALHTDEELGELLDDEVLQRRTIWTIKRD